MKTGEENRLESEPAQQEEEKESKETVVIEEHKEEERMDTSEASESTTIEDNHSTSIDASKEPPQPSVAKTEPEKRAAVPVVAVAPVMSVKPEVVQKKERELNEDTMPQKENLELRIKNSPTLVSVQPLPTPDSSSIPIKLDCTFCRNLGMSEEVATSHVIRNSEGKVICPELRKRSCSLCGATGENSHSAVFCPLKSQQTMGESVSDTPRIALIASQRPPSSYNKTIVNERRGGYRGSYGGGGHRGGFHQNRGGGRYQSENRHYK